MARLHDYTKSKSFFAWLLTQNKKMLWLFLMTAFCLFGITMNLFPGLTYNYDMEMGWRIFVITFLIIILILSWLQPYRIYKKLRKLEGRN